MTGEIKYKFLDPFLLLVDKTEIWGRFYWRFQRWRKKDRDASLSRVHRRSIGEMKEGGRNGGGGGGGKTKFRDNGYWKKFCGQPLQADTKHRTAGAQFVLTH